MAARVVVATQHFAYAEKGREVFVHTGERFTTNHPAVKRYPEWFKPAEAEVKKP